MFGFQRTGDLAWASGDIRAKGFMIGATSGRTTLNGEGLQHQDGHSHVLASTIPNCISYDPTYGYELAVIIQDGLRRMYGEQENVYYYITTMNENYAQPAIPEGEGIVEGILKGLYPFSKSAGERQGATGSVAWQRHDFQEVRAAAEILKNEFGVEADIWGATSFNELRQDGLDVARWNMLHPEQQPRVSWVEQQLAGAKGPVVVATDYIRLYGDQIREFVPNSTFIVLGTDGFGRSDTRENLRHFFEVDRNYMAYAALAGFGDARVSWTRPCSSKPPRSWVSTLRKRLPNTANSLSADELSDDQPRRGLVQLKGDENGRVNQSSRSWW